MFKRNTLATLARTMHKIGNNKLPISTLNMFDFKTNSRYNPRGNNRDFILGKLNIIL